MSNPTIPVVVIWNPSEGLEVHRPGCRDIARKRADVIESLDVPSGAAGRRAVEAAVNYDFPDDPHAVRVLPCSGLVGE